MADSLLLDASLLLHARTASEVRTALEEEFVPSPGEVMVPETVYRIAGGDLDYYQPLLSVYGGQRRSGISSADDLAWIRDTEIYPYSVFPEAPSDVGDLSDAVNVFMELTEGNFILSRLLVEEWVFLTRNSWIAARHTRDVRVLQARRSRCSRVAATSV
jgi:hypothetical protein